MQALRLVTLSPWFFGGMVLSWLLLALIAAVLLRRWRGMATLRGRLDRIGLLVFTLGLVFLALEGAVRFFPVLGSSQIDLLAEQWRQRHWAPVNSLGCRDVEPDVAKLAAGTSIFILGDSFAAGLGISRHGDVFGKRLEAQLGTDHCVAILADPGWNLTNYQDALQGHPFQTPDIVVLSLVFNDIETDPSALAAPYADQLFPQGAVGFFTNISFLLSAVHARYTLAKLMPDLKRGLLAFFDEPGAVARLHENLDRLEGLVSDRGAQLIVMVWPMFTEPGMSATMNAHLLSHFEGKPYPLIDMSRALELHDPRELVVSSADVHPNERAHALAAQWLADEVRALRPDALP